MVSNNPTILSNTDRIIRHPQTTQVVSYIITITIDSNQQAINLYLIVPGTESWKQLNGFYSTR